MAYRLLLLLSACAACATTPASDDASEEIGSTGEAATATASTGVSTTGGPGSGAEAGPGSGGDGASSSTTDEPTPETSTASASGSDSTGEPEGGQLSIEIHNVSETHSIYLEACPRCGSEFRVFEAGTNTPVYRMSTVLDCPCGNCKATGCLGHADPPVGWIELPPGVTKSLTWNALHWDLAGTCPGEIGCIDGEPVAAADYELRIAYLAEAQTSEQRDCPTGGDKLLYDQPDGTVLAECIDLICISTICPSDPALVSEVVVPFSWPTDETLEIDLSE